jgi:hypothetical protein
VPRRDQTPITISDFDGIHSYPRLYNLNGDVDSVGKNGAEIVSNLMHLPNGHLISRPGIIRALQIDSGGSSRGVKRAFTFPLTSGRQIVITHAGRVFDTTFSTVTPILTAAVGSDLSVVTVGNRVFLSVTPVSGNAGIFIWDPATMATARAAAGLKPTGTFTVAVSATNGNIEPGQHIYAVAFETTTGYITKPNLYVSLTSPAIRKKTDLNPIPTGPAGTAARWILMSKVLRNWDGNLQGPELFFAQRIADNTTTSLTGASGLDKFDTELLSSADYLKDLIEELPKANGLTLYGGRLTLVGGAAATDPVRVSQPGDYETFLATEGYIKALPLSGGAANIAFELYGALYICKDARTYATEDSGASPTRWTVISVDSARGCSPIGVSKTASGAIDVEGGTCLLTREGLHYFDGKYGDLPLTYKIGGLFSSLLVTLDFTNWSVVVDTTRKTIYIFVGSQPTVEVSDNYLTTQIIVGDYSRGLTWDKIRWSTFGHYSTFSCISVDYDSQLLPRIRFGQGANLATNLGWLFSMDPPENDSLTDQFADFDRSGIWRSVPWKWLCGALGLSLEGGRTQFDAVGMRAAPMGAYPAEGQPVKARLYNCDDNVYVDMLDLPLPKHITSDLVATTLLTQCDLVAERAKIELSSSSDANPVVTKGIRLEAVHVHCSPYGEEIPQ